MKKYQVIGGQYEEYWYGETDSLHAAKLLATRSEEYWDNFQGWHKPAIYSASDVCDIISSGRITTRDGAMIRVRKPDTMPICYWDARCNRWLTDIPEA